MFGVHAQLFGGWDGAAPGKFIDEMLNVCRRYPGLRSRRSAPNASQDGRQGLPEIAERLLQAEHAECGNQARTLHNRLSAGDGVLTSKPEAVDGGSRVEALSPFAFEMLVLVSAAASRELRSIGKTNALSARHATRHNDAILGWTWV